MANQTKRLARLIRDADKCAGGATAAVQSAIKDIKGRIALATQELNLAGKAADRDKLFAEIHDRISRLEGELTRYLNAAAEMGSTAGFQAGKDETGLQVKYSAERANAILETVTERNGGELAATFTQNMENEIVGALRTATVEAIRAQAITGGTLKGMSKDLAQRMKDAARDFTFTDSRGRKWDSAAYFQMNTRTNAMRIYNDTLADTIARATGSDLARISGGGDPNCKHCFPWEGRVISLTGKTPGFPTYEDARAAGCFHPNCVHTLEYLDETADADEIALQKQFPPERDEEGEITADAADENRYEIDIARKMADNPELDATAAKVLVDRDNLAASIRNGAIRADAEKIVAGLTDAQVAALCPDGNPPAFMAAKDNPDKGAEGWNKGSFGGKVYISGQTSGLTAQRLAEITGIGEGKAPTPPENADKLAKLPEIKAAAETEKRDNPRTLADLGLTIDEVRKMPIAEAIKATEKLNAQYADLKPTERETKYVELSEQRHNLVEEYKAAKKVLKNHERAYRNGELTYEQFVEKSKEVSAIYNKWMSVYNEMRKMMKPTQVEQIAQFYINDETNAKRIADGKCAPDLKKDFEESKRIIERIYAKEYIPDTGLDCAILKGGAAWFEGGGRKIHISRDNAPDDFTHEISHWIEEKNPHILKRCIEFQDKRFASRKPGQKDGDLFPDAYCAKRYMAYPRGGEPYITGTELLTQGVQWLTEKPAWFKAKDPEYFNFTLAVIRGQI